MKILIVGTGYVGLVTGSCFAEMGHHVICLDIDQEKIKNLQEGKIPIYEPGLEELIKHNHQKRLFFTTNYVLAVKNAEVIFMALPTPANEDGSCNTSYIETAVKTLALHLEHYVVIVNKSTVPVGTAFLVKNWVKQSLKDRKSFLEFDVVSNPEFLKEGTAICDCMKPDRIVIGAETEKALFMMKEIYAPFMINHDKILTMDVLSAEMTKYAANAMLAARISFMNELAEICKRIGADVNQIRKGIGSDSRIGYSFLYPGVGYGGSCFPKDIRALTSIAKSVGYKPELLEAVDHINQRQKTVLPAYIAKYFADKGGLQGKVLAVWGLSFKPETDDMREAPSLTIIQSLLEAGATIKVFDPVAMDKAKQLKQLQHPNVVWCSDEFEAAKGTHGIALLTEWKQFRLMDFKALHPHMQHHVVFDGRNQYEARKLEKQGFNYIGIGTPDYVKT